MGVIVLDAGIIIAALDGSDAHHGAAVRALRDARDGGDTLVVPASAYAEALVGPSRRGADAIATVEAFLRALPASVEPASRDIAHGAAGLRAVHGSSLRLPDALVLATAQVLHADTVLTTDAGWPTTGIEVTVLRPR